MKIGILKEGKTPPDKRVPFLPLQCKQIFESYPQVRIVAQPSPIRCVMDEEYSDAGIPLQTDLSDCDVLMGIKEVNIEELIEDKTYFFFSHTIKKQEYNKKLLQSILEKKIRLIDYELLTYEHGIRIIGFGKWAGIVGAYNGLRAFSIRNKMPEPKPAHLCSGLKELKKEAGKVSLPPIKIVLTGGGRVANGSMELLDSMGIKKVPVETYLENKEFDEPVYVQLEPDSYNLHKKGKEFNMSHFFSNPEEYKGDFKRFCDKTDMLISAAYWDPKAPVLFTREDMQQKEFRISVIADITCDIGGSIPSTIRSSTIEDPFYGYNPFSGKEELAFVDPKNISIMAVDNLPCELPKDASKDFGDNLIEKIVPYLVGNDSKGILAKATIAENGKLTERYKYLKEWVNS